MGADAMTPTPPPGFTLDASPDAGSMPPPPPPGFTLDQPGQSQGGYWSDVGKNAVREIKAFPRGALDTAQTAMNLNNIPADAVKYPVQKLFGDGPTDLSQDVQPIVEGNKQTLNTIFHPIDSFRQAPINTVGTAAGLLGAAKMGVGELPAPSEQGLTEAANKRWFKALGGTLQQAKEIGPQEAQRLGRLARNEKIITPTNSPESQMENLQGYQNAAGQKIGELRKMGDQIGASPKFHELISEIENELGPQYSQGMMSPQQGQFRNAMDELMKTEKVKKMPPEIPEGEGSYPVEQTEPNPLYTPVPKELEAQGQPAPPLPRSSIFDRSNLPKGYVNAENARSAPEPMKYKNPMFLSDQPQLRSTKDVPRNLFEDYRGDQESGNITPEYEISKPGTTDIANKVTQMNKFAEKQTKLLQPSNALTDVANAASSKNDAALVQSLGSGKGLEYVDALGKFADSEKMMRILENKLAYETGASRNRIVNNLMNRFEQRFGYPVSAEVLDRLSKMVKGQPMFSKNGSNMTMAGSAAKELTTQKAKDILKQAGGDRDKARQIAKDQGFSF